MQVFVKLRNEERGFTVNLLQKSTWTTIMSRSSFVKRTAPLITQMSTPQKLHFTSPYHHPITITCQIFIY